MLEAEIINKNKKLGNDASRQIQFVVTGSLLVSSCIFLLSREIIICQLKLGFVIYFWSLLLQRWNGDTGGHQILFNIDIRHVHEIKWP